MFNKTFWKMSETSVGKNRPFEEKQVKQYKRVSDSGSRVLFPYYFRSAVYGTL